MVDTPHHVTQRGNGCRLLTDKDREVYLDAFFDYARYANLARRSCGHFWQSRFYSCALDGQHAWEALAYVERNPVRAGLVEKAEDYRWSTAAAHCREDGLDGLLDLEPWGRQFAGEYWREVLGIGLRDAAMEERIREATRRGSPTGR